MLRTNGVSCQNLPSARQCSAEGMTLIKLSNKLQGSGNMDLTLYMKTQGQQNNLTVAHQCGWLGLSSQSTKDASVEHSFLSTIWGNLWNLWGERHSRSRWVTGWAFEGRSIIVDFGLRSLTMKKAFLYVPATEDPLAPHLVFLTVMG